MVAWMGIPLLLAAAPLPESPIADAVMAGDLEAVRNLLRDGADVNEAQGDGLTGLHWAARNNDVEAARLLLYAGANVAAKTRIGAHTPVLVASRGGHAEVLDVLLEAGADPVARTTTGNSAPLHFAAAAGNPAAVEVLLKHGADVDARDGGSLHTPLMIAATYDHVAVARALLANGADVALTNEVVDMAAREAEDRELRDRRERRVAFLQELQSGASNAPAEEAQAPPPEEPPAADEDAQEEEEEEEAATAEQDEDAAEEPSPLSYPQLVGNHGGYSALHLAARQGSRGVAEVLLQAGADIDQPSAGDHTTPMLMASINGHWDMALDFLERGADPNIASAAGTTPLYAILNLHWAPAAFYPQPTAHLNQRTTYLEAMRTLLEAGADPNARLEKHLWFMSYNFDLLGVDTFGATPFWRAAYGTDVEAMELLVSYGADPTVPTRKPAERRRRGGGDSDELDPSGLPPVPYGGPSVTPLHAASGAGYGQGRAGNSHRHVPGGWLPAVRYLVEEHGLDVNARDHDGYTPLHHAASRGDMDVIRYLVERGADPKAVSRSGQSTADMANGPVQRIQPFPEARDFLVQLGAKNNDNCRSC
jgi:ankyrin repeat protein